MIVLNRKEKNRVDILFMYESKVREIEGVCLIAGELAKRGYCTAILETWEPLIKGQRKRPEAEVVFIPSAYTDRSLYALLRFVKGPAKVINLQWEQIYSRRDLTNPNSPWKMSGDVHKVTHISWGDVNYNKLTESDHIDKRMVKKVGHVGLDYLRKELRGFYLSREEICREFDIDVNTRLCLFISSFSFVNLPENMIEPELRELFEVSIRSQKEIVRWIVSVLEKHKELTFVYRPHPSEAGNAELAAIAAREPRFKIIKDYSVKQWIIVSDIIYNWYSTSVAEVYFAGKSCFFLRPYPIALQYECLIMEELTSLTSCEEFEGSLNASGCDFPVPEEAIRENYFYDEKCPAYIRIADICEELFRAKSGYLKKELTLKERFNNLKLLVKNSGAGKMIEGLRGSREMDPKDAEYLKYITEMYNNNIVTESEFMSMKERLDRLGIWA